MDYMCPVCGYPRLTEPPRTEATGGSFEICPSCGFQFGVSDDDRGFSYDGWRQEWVENGCPWRWGPRPPGWDGALQLKGLRSGR